MRQAPWRRGSTRSRSGSTASSPGRRRRWRARRRAAARAARPPAPVAGRSTAPVSACATRSPRCAMACRIRGSRRCRRTSPSLQQSVAQLQGSTVAERQQSFNAMATNIRSRARDIAARSNELGKSTATEMRAIAAAVSVAPGQSGFSCYDPTLAQRLTQAAVQADQPATLNLREAAFNEGPAGVANAIKRLVGEYRRLPVEPHRLDRRRRARWRHQDRRADHGPRYDRAARHHRYRFGPSGAGHPQSAAAGEQTPVVGRLSGRSAPP